MILSCSASWPLSTVFGFHPHKKRRWMNASSWGPRRERSLQKFERPHLEKLWPQYRVNWRVGSGAAQENTHTHCVLIHGQLLDKALGNFNFFLVPCKLWVSTSAKLRHGPNFGCCLWSGTLQLPTSWMKSITVCKKKACDPKKQKSSVLMHMGYIQKPPLYSPLAGASGSMQVLREQLDQSLLGFSRNRPRGNDSCLFQFFHAMWID